jgi:hypothetical protein
LKKVKFRKYTCVLALWLVGLIFQNSAEAQQYEVGGGLGISTYSGDIIRRLDPGQIGLQGTLFGRRNFDNVWSLRGGLSVGRLNAADSIRPIDQVMAYRDAFFQGTLLEASAVMEYHFLDFTHPQSLHKFSPYGFFGLGYTLFTGSGQTFAGDPEAGRYSTSTPVIPFGIGLKFKLTEKWTLATELGIRATFTDLLDKIDSKSPQIPRFENPTDPDMVFGYNHGNYSDRDWYYFVGVTLSYSFSSVKCFPY